MEYRDFGKLGIRVSALGFGAMRLPEDEDEAVRVIRRAIDLGVNYLDTAPRYCQQRSEGILGRAVKGYPREKLYLSTKYPPDEAATADDCQKYLEQSLRRMGLDYIDFYHMWGISWKVYEEKLSVKGGPLEYARKAKDEGLIRHISFSFHDTPEALHKLIDTGEFESMTVQYNVLDRANEDGIHHAHEQGMGVAIMGTVGGGRLGFPSETIMKAVPGGVTSTPELALRFVLSHPGVGTALSGMGSIRMVEENAATASRAEPLSEDERRRLREMYEENKKLADLYCTGCGYCQPCPNEVNIPENFRYMNYHRIWGLTEYAKREYAVLGTGKNQFVKGLPAHECIECGECEPKCPQKLPIIAQLKETAQALRP
ncbi:MAG TPA: aldo/keto reductase [Bacillota bacterium]|jgi:hypothetical protein